MLLTKGGEACTQVRLGRVLIRVKTKGINRTELMTRQGHSRSVAFVRVLGIERIGTVEPALQDSVDRVQLADQESRVPSQNVAGIATSSPLYLRPEP